MLKRVLLLCFFFCGFLTACKPAAPDGYDSQGHPIRLADYREKALLVAIWADWCDTCVKELPVLDQFAKRHTDQWVVLGVNFDHLPAKRLQALAAKWHVSFPLLSQLSLDSLGASAPLDALPALLLVSKDRKRMQWLYGPHSEKEFMAAAG